VMLLYAVVAADANAPETRGLHGHRLETIRGALAAVIVEECSARLRATGEESRAFAKIICDLATTTSMLPIRFPAMLPTRSAVLSELQENEATWRRRLAELDGLSEVVIRAQEPEIDHELGVAPDGSGTTYLVDRAAVIHRQEASVTEISGLVRAWSREIKVLPPQQGIRLACLVAGADVPQLREAVLTWQQARSGRQAVVSGPWPVFSFVGDQETVSR
jgi:Gas vesicle synthesis protein GvpL/GvpF